MLLKFNSQLAKFFNVNGFLNGLLIWGFCVSILTGFSGGSTINRSLTGFKGEAVNFTWPLPSYPFRRLFFGRWSKLSESVITSFITVRKYRNGSIKILLNDGTSDINAQDYYGRVRWFSDVADKGFATFEISTIRNSDQGNYGFEVEFQDMKHDLAYNWTRLIVKPPSVFTFGPRTISTVRGRSAQFSWQYSLNNDDRERLSMIQFGDYKRDVFTEICHIKVSKGLVKSTGCTTAQLAPTTNVTFIQTNVDLNDEAVYEIRLVGTFRRMHNKTRLIVHEPPSIVTQPKDVVVIENHVLNLTCGATGKPRPLITWKRDGITVQENHQSTYTVSSTQLKDAGEYQCIASNIVRSDKSTLVKVDVQYAPRINVSSNIIKKHVPLGKSEWLKCPANAHPPATFKWYSDGIIDQRNGENIQVKISKVEDYKNYTCVAENFVGKDNVTFVLRQVGPPSLPKVSCDKREDTSDSRIQKLHWKVPSDDGGAPVVGYVVKHRTLRGHTYKGPWRNTNVSFQETWYRLQLDWETTFELTVTAINKYGESELNSDRSPCVVKIGKDPSMVTTPVVAAAKRDVKPTTLSLVYVGVSIGAAVVFVALVIAVALYVRRRQLYRRHHVKKSLAEHHMSFNQLNQILDPSIPHNDKRLGSRHHTMVGSPCYQMDPNWTIPRERICILKVIGNGAFGLVYKGRVHGVGSDTVGWSMVAIKTPYADATDSEVRDLMKEFELLKALKPHPYVIRLLGCGEDEGRPLVIIEYVPFGDLLGYLRKSRGEDDDYYSDPEIKPNTNLSSQQLLRFGWNIADGMAYLASQKIIHRDLAARNVLVGEGLACKVTDFGMAKDISNDDIYVRTTEGRLPVKWTAIEALTGSGEYTTQSDVWSFGVVLYEICTIGSDPYPGIAGKEIPDRIERGYRMPRPSHVDPVLYDVMLRCWNNEPDKRPTFPDLKEVLMKLEDAQCKDYINLAECLYQNVQISGSKQTCAVEDLTVKKGNDYHASPRLSHSNAAQPV